MIAEQRFSILTFPQFFDGAELTVNIVVVRLAAHRIRGNQFHFAECIHRRNIVRPRVSERCDTSRLVRIPRQVFLAVAVVNDAILPLAFQNFGSRTRRGRIRVSAEVADAGVNMQFAVCRDSYQAVEAFGAR